MRAVADALEEARALHLGYRKAHGRADAVDSAAQNAETAVVHVLHRGSWRLLDGQALAIKARAQRARECPAEAPGQRRAQRGASNAVNDDKPQLRRVPDVQVRLGGN